MGRIAPEDQPYIEKQIRDFFATPPPAK
jgi:hypothetical protein